MRTRPETLLRSMHMLRTDCLELWMWPTKIAGVWVTSETEGERRVRPVVELVDKWVSRLQAAGYGPREYSGRRPLKRIGKGMEYLAKHVDQAYGELESWESMVAEFENRRLQTDAMLNYKPNQLEVLKLGR
jgi:hypothetical protein